MVDSTSKILALGNSFLAAMRETMVTSDYPVTFVGGSGRVMDDFVLHKNEDRIALGGKSAESATQQKFWELTTGSDEPVSLDEFDTFIIVGAVCPPNAWLRTNLIVIDEPLPEIVTAQAPISFGLYTHVSRYRPYLERAKRLIDLIRQHNKERKILLVPFPHAMEGAEEFSDIFGRYPWWDGLSLSDKEILQRNEDAIYERFFNLSGGTVVLPPAEVVIDGNRCPKKFTENALGSENFEDGSKPAWGKSDLNMNMYLTHKNKDYGEIVWEGVLERLQE